jgi:hypothetical protein
MSLSRALRSVRLVLAIAGAALIGGFGLAAPAAAYGPVDPAGATRDGDARMAFRVPDERNNADTVTFEVTPPRGHVTTSVRTTSAPEWSAVALKEFRADAAQPAAASGLAMSSGRLGAIVAALLGLIGVVIGGLALARPASRVGTGNGRGGATLALLAGVSALALGGLVVATSDAGIGTGNGRGGAYVALVVGLISVVLGGLAMTRSRPR